MSARGHEVVEHTADVGLHVWAPTLDEVFAEAAIGLVAIMGRGTGPSTSERVDVDSPDLDALFVDWLSEVLFLFDARAVVPSDVRVRIDREACALSATIDGVKAESFVQEGPAVKAVTFHGLSLSGTDAVVFVDV
jgi:SHS2 domain-containing protein